MEHLPRWGKDVAQPWIAAADRLQDIGRAIAVLDVGAMDEDEQLQPERVRDDVAVVR